MRGRGDLGAFAGVYRFPVFFCLVSCYYSCQYCTCVVDQPVKSINCLESICVNVCANKNSPSVVSLYLILRFGLVKIVACLTEAKEESNETCWVSSLSSYPKQETQLRSLGQLQPSVWTLEAYSQKFCVHCDAVHMWL